MKRLAFSSVFSVVLASPFSRRLPWRKCRVDRSGQDSVVKPCHNGRATVQTFGSTCALDYSGCDIRRSLAEVRIR
jgi:hypothetical protein